MSICTECVTYTHLPLIAVLGVTLEVSLLDSWENHKKEKMRTGGTESSFRRRSKGTLRFPLLEINIYSLRWYPWMVAQDGERRELSSNTSNAEQLAF